MADGVLVIDKPAGPTSHDVVARVRRLLGESRIGHTGTLDPLATGVLALVVGRATRLAQFMSGDDKGYDATVRLGFPTDTRDAHGEACGVRFEGEWPSREQIDRALDAFRGTFLQQPPAFSAKKIGGVRSYRIARAAAGHRLSSNGAGAPPPARTDADARPRISMSSGSHGRGSSLSIPQPVTVTVHHLEIVHVAGDIVTLRIDCSSGFYVRSLAHDLGERLGTGAHLAALRRTRSGEFTLEHAVALDEAERDPEALPARMLPTDRLLGSLPGLSVTREGARRVAHGRSLGPADFTDPEALAAFGLAPGTGAVRLLDDEGRLLAIAGPGGTPGVLHPRVVLG